MAAFLSEGKPSVYPFKRSPWSGVADAIAAYVNNSMASQLYGRQQQRLDRDEAMNRLMLLSRVPGGLRGAPSGAWESAGMAQPPSIPMSKEEIEAQGIENFWRQHPEYAGWPTPMIVADINAKAERANITGSYDAAAKLLGGPGMGQPPTGGVQSAPPSELSGAPPSVSPTITTRELGVGPKGATVKLGETVNPAWAQAQKDAKLRSDLTAQTRAVDEQYSAGQLDRMAKTYGTTVEEVRSGIVNDRLRQMGHTINEAAPSWRNIRQAGEQRRAEEHRQATEKHRETQLENTQQQIEATNRRLELLSENSQRAAERGDAREAMRWSQMRIDQIKTTIRDLQQQRQAYEDTLKGTMDTKMLANEPRIKWFNAQINDLTNEMIKAVSEAKPASVGGAKPGGTTLRPRLNREGMPGGWFK